MRVWQHDWLTRWALYSPQKLALKEHETGDNITYGQLNAYSNKIVANLHQ